MNSLELGIIGNGTIGALINPEGEIVWSCFPRLDGNPLFCSLLREHKGKEGKTDKTDFGFYSVAMIGHARSEQSYLPNTAILVTRLHDEQGGCIEITDYMPRFHLHGRVFRPMSLIRRISRISGSPRIVIRLRPACDYGARAPEISWG